MTPASPMKSRIGRYSSSSFSIRIPRGPYPGASSAPKQPDRCYFAGAVWIGPALAQGGFKGRFAAEKQENSGLGAQFCDRLKRCTGARIRCESLLTESHFQTENGGRLPSGSVGNGREPATHGIPAEPFPERNGGSDGARTRDLRRD